MIKAQFWFMMLISTLLVTQNSLFWLFVLYFAFMAHGWDKIKTIGEEK